MLEMGNGLNNGLVFGFFYPGSGGAAGWTILLLLITLAVVLVLYRRSVRRHRLFRDLLLSCCDSFEISVFRFDGKKSKLRRFEGRPSRFWPRENGEPIPFDRWILPEEQSLAREAIRQLMSGDRQERGFTMHSDFTGERRTYTLICRYAKEDLAGINSGEIYGLIQDVTEICTERAKYNDSRLLLEKIMASLPFPIYTKELDSFRFASYNAVLENLLSMGVGSPLGKKFQDFPGAKDIADEVEKHDREVASLPPGEVRCFPEKYCRSNGEIFYCNSYKQRIEFSNGKNCFWGLPSM